MEPEKGQLENETHLQYQTTIFFGVPAVRFPGGIWKEWNFQTLRRCSESHLSHENNPVLLSIESWLFNSDPYNGSI